MNNFHSRPIFDQPFRESLPNPKHPPYTYIAEVTRPKRLHQACNALLRDVGTAKEVQVGEPWTVRGKSLQGGVFHCAAQAEAEVGELCAGGGHDGGGAGGGEGGGGEGGGTEGGAWWDA